MRKPLKSVVGNPVSFVQKLLKELKEAGVTFKGEIDHLCYRVGNYESYILKKKELSQLGTLISEAQVNGRPIATYKLREPLEVEDPFDEDKVYEIPLVELPAPKQGREYEEKLEHLEIVIFEDLKVFMDRHPQISFDVADMQKSINPDVSLKLTSGSIKFHNQSLEAVIELEERIASGQDPRTIC